MSLPNAGSIAPQAPTLPLEIVEEIATHASGKDTFKAASTVSRAWLSAFRPKLFAHIVLGKRFVAATASPIFADDKRLLPFITSVKVQGILTALVNEKLLVALNMLPKLESLELSGVGFGWDQTTPQSTELLVQLLQKESLQMLSVEFAADHYSGFPLALIPFCRRVRTLNLEDTRLLLPLFSETHSLFSSLTRNLENLECSEPSPVALRTLKLSGTGLISRFAHFHSQYQGWLSPNSLERLELDYADSRTGTPSRAVGELLRAFGTSVKMLSITVYRPEDLRGGPPLNTVDLEKLHQVHTLELTLSSEADDDFAIFVHTWACHVLETLSAKDSITKIAITCQIINYPTAILDYFTPSLDPVYSALDLVLGSQAGFESLKECTIVFKPCGRVAVRMISTEVQANQGHTDEEPLEDKFPCIQERKINFYAAFIPGNL